GLVSLPAPPRHKVHQVADSHADVFNVIPTLPQDGLVVGEEPHTLRADGGPAHGEAAGDGDGSHGSKGLPHPRKFIKSPDLRYSENPRRWLGIVPVPVPISRGARSPSITARASSCWPATAATCWRTG